MNVQQAHNQFIRECQDGTLKRRADATMQSYHESFRLLLKLFPVKMTEDLTEGILRQFLMRGERERGWKPGTIISYRKNLAPFFKWCVDRGHMPANPLEAIPTPPLIKNLPEFYSQSEMESIMYHVNMAAKTDLERVRNVAMFGVMAMAGLRKGELLGLRVTDLDFENGVIRIRAETSKSRTARSVPICFRLRELLERYLREREKHRVETIWLWVSYHGRTRFTANGLKHLTRHISERSGIRIKPHKFRHTFATQTYMGSSDIIAVQRALGHKEITTTMIYTQVNQKQVHASIEKNPINSIF
ncbi:MAG: tyrosine-type recombinase/integrase [Patescibacteria group bacterium]